MWAQHGIHETVHAIIASLGKKHTALDAASGPGALTHWLTMRGVRTVAVDLGRETDHTGLRARPSVIADLNARLPFDNGSFDLVVSIETIEHLENPHLFLREIARVLKPCGHVVLATPNPHSFASRLKYAVLGLPSMFDFVAKDAYGGHISPVSIGTMLYAFDQTGVTIELVESVGRSHWIRKLPNALMWPLVRYLHRSRRFSDDHYVRRLTPQQLRRLNDEWTLNQTTQHWHTGSTHKRVISVRLGHRVYESRVD
jgi:SAM-dependent methyltransferase